MSNEDKYIILVEHYDVRVSNRFLRQFVDEGYGLIWLLADEAEFEYPMGVIPGFVHVHDTPEALDRLISLHPEGTVVVPEYLDGYLALIEENVFFKGKVMTYDDKALYPKEIRG